jgi:hypothetical protein
MTWAIISPTSGRLSISRRRLKRRRARRVGNKGRCRGRRAKGAMRRRSLTTIVQRGMSR